MSDPATPAPAENAAQSVVEHIKTELDKLAAAPEAATSAAVVSAADVQGVLDKYSHDIIGKAHRIFEDMKALVTKAEASV